MNPLHHASTGLFRLATFWVGSTAALVSADESDIDKTDTAPALHCSDYFSRPTESGVLVNNVWNKMAAGEQSWSQCIEERQIDGQTQHGWSWSWPRGKRVIYAYPQIKVGVSPWAPTPAFDERFPVAINAIDSLKVAHDLELQTDGQLNVATSLWITSETYRGTEPKPSIIKAEFMIWTYRTEQHFNPAGRKIDIVEIEDAEWELWVDQDWTDASGVNSNRWIYITLKATRNRLATEIDISKMLSELTQRDLLSPNWYVADIELGNEIMSGSGQVWINDFQVELNVHTSPERSLNPSLTSE